MVLEQEILVAVGSNLGSDCGNPVDTVLSAAQLMGEHGLNVTQMSRVFRTPCFPPGAGPDYANAAMRVTSEGGAGAVLARLHAVEAAFGRVRRQRWASRTLDLDLLAMGDSVLPDRATQDRWRGLPLEDQLQEAPGQLILPHPRLQDRAFVLVPLLDIAPDWRHPVLGLTVAQMCAALPEEDVSAVVPL